MSENVSQNRKGKRISEKGIRFFSEYAALPFSRLCQEVCVTLFLLRAGRFVMPQDQPCGIAHISAAQGKLSFMQIKRSGPEVE